MPLRQARHPVLADAPVEGAARSSSGPNVPPCLSVVPVLPPRSAEPPTRLGTAVAIAWSARPEACRVASGRPAGGERRERSASQPSGSAPASQLAQLGARIGVRRPRSARRRAPFGLERRAPRHRLAPVRPARRRARRTCGSSGQPMISLVRRTSSAPSGAPCASAVSRLVGRRVGDVRCGARSAWGAPVSAVAASSAVGDGARGRCRRRRAARASRRPRSAAARPR